MVKLYDPKPSNPKPLSSGQFSQGTLFTPPKPSAEHRWPQGFTPERKAAVASRLERSTISVEPRFNPYMSRGKSHVKSATFKGKDDLNEGRAKPLSPQRNVKARSAQARGMITTMLARSSAPVESMGELPNFDIKQSTRKGGSFSYPNRAGRDVRGTIQMNPIGGGFGPNEQQHTEHTLLHEVGHHADYVKDPIEFIERARDDMRMGRASPSLEGAAEGYAAAHATPHPKDEPLPYSEKASYKYMQGHPTFDRRFAEQTGGRTPQEMMGPRQQAHMGTQFDQQAHLFGRPVDISVSGTQVEHGQWGYTNYSGPGREEPLGTIKVGRGAPAEPQYQRGYHPGDTEAVQELKRGRGYTLENRQRERVTKTWNERNPTDKLRKYL